MHLLWLDKCPIFEQLQIEEALLRADEREWCVINSGSSPAIVMGISGKPEELVNPSLAKRNEIPLIKRFSGGGTVFVDEQTLFVTFIRNGVGATPKKIMEWSDVVYRPLFPKGFAVRENDYVLGEKKFGGNAQYIQKGRWLHHTSFLWDYCEKKMEVLLQPKKQPVYRQKRIHKDFLCPLHPHFESPDEFFELLVDSLGLEESDEEIETLLERPHRKSSRFVDL